VVFVRATQKVRPNLVEPVQIFAEAVQLPAFEAGVRVFLFAITKGVIHAVEPAGVLRVHGEVPHHVVLGERKNLFYFTPLPHQLFSGWEWPVLEGVYLRPTRHKLPSIPCQLPSRCQKGSQQI
jgi:hypothetical protein